MARKKNTGEAIADIQGPLLTSENIEATAPCDEPQPPTESVKKILQTFTSHAELWVSRFGGVYKSKPTTVQGAILYKNPFYKP